MGEGEGTGFNVNVPLSPSADDATYAAAFDRIVLPIADQFAPELVLLSAGFDAHARDPLAGMVLTAAGFARLARGVRQLADRHAGGRVGVFLEGGYDLEGLESSLGATLAALTGQPGPTAPPAANVPALPSRHAHELAHVEKTLRDHWRL
jgi:acetoin utilization deacetylase AcuC-like enzyme